MTNDEKFTSKFIRFNFVDDISMEVIITFKESENHFFSDVEKLINWIMKNCNKISDVILFTKLFANKHEIKIFFNQQESTYLLMIDYELLKKYVAELNEKIIFEGN